MTEHSEGTDRNIAPKTRTILTPEIIGALTKYLAIGMSYRDAAKAVGIPDYSIYKWSGKGRSLIARGGEYTPAQKLFVALAKAIEAAKPKHKAVLLNMLHRDAMGGHQVQDIRRVYRSVPVEVRDQTGKLIETKWETRLVEETITEKTAKPDTKATMWLLERVYPAEFGKRLNVDMTDWRGTLPPEYQKKSGEVLQQFRQLLDGQAEEREERVATLVEGEVVELEENSSDIGQEKA